MIPTMRTARHGKASLVMYIPVLLPGALALLLLTGCQSTRLSTSSCLGAAPGSQTAQDCQYVAALTRTRVAGN